MSCLLRHSHLDREAVPGTVSREAYTGITTGNAVDDYARTKHNQPFELACKGPAHP